MKASSKHLKLLVITSVATAIIPLTSLAEDKVAIQIQQYKENDDRIKFLMEN